MPKKNGIGAYLRGMIRFEIIGGMGERFLNVCAQEGLVMEQITATQTGYLAKTTVHDYKKMHRIARKHRCRLRMREKYGARFSLWAYHNRFGMLFGAILCVFLLYACRTLVWNIAFDSTKFTMAEQTMLRRQLVRQNIYEGAFVTQKQLEKAQSELFIAHADYGWAKLNFVKGRVLVEKTIATQKPPILPSDITNVVATADGVVQKAEVASGFLRVSEGQGVAEGDILVSGENIGVTKIPYYTHAEAKIFAQIERTYAVTQAHTVTAQLPSGRVKIYRKLMILGYAIPLYQAKNAPKVQKNMRQTVQVVPLIWHGFHFPASIEETELREMETVNITYTPEMAREIACMKAEDAFLRDFKEHVLQTQTVRFSQTKEAQTVYVKFAAVADIAKTVPFAQ